MSPRLSSRPRSASGAREPRDDAPPVRLRRAGQAIGEVAAVWVYVALVERGDSLAARNHLLEGPFLLLQSARVRRVRALPVVPVIFLADKARVRREQLCAC